MRYLSEEDEQWVAEDFATGLPSKPPVRLQRRVRTRPMMTQDEIRSKRQYACDVGHNAGNCIGNMCNYLMDDQRTNEQKRERMQQSLNVAEREISELQSIARELMAQVS